jgi:hypothetical protein
MQKPEQTSCSENPACSQRASLRKQLLVLCLGGALLCAAVLIICLSGPKEPSYEGKKLSEWMKIVSPSGQYGAWLDLESAQGQAAIRSIGTNALPSLLKWISYEMPQWQVRVETNLTRGPAFCKRIAAAMKAREIRAGRAVQAFGALGREAEPAVPELAALLRTGGKRSEQAAVAVWLMSEKGADVSAAIPGLILMDQKKPGVRATINGSSFWASDYIGLFTQRKWFVAGVSNALHDPLPEVRKTALGLLYSRSARGEVDPNFAACLTNDPNRDVRLTANLYLDLPYPQVRNRQRLGK